MQLPIDIFIYVNQVAKATLDVISQINFENIIWINT